MLILQKLINKKHAISRLIPASLSNNLRYPPPETGRHYVLSQAFSTLTIATMRPGSITPLPLAALLAFACCPQADAAIPAAADIQTPQIGDHALHILSPNVLELFLVNTKQPDPGHVNLWDWVDGNQNFVSPNTSGI